MSVCVGIVILIISAMSPGDPDFKWFQTPFRRLLVVIFGLPMFLAFILYLLYLLITNPEKLR